MKTLWIIPYKTHFNRFKTCQESVCVFGPFYGGVFYPETVGPLGSDGEDSLGL